MTAFQQDSSADVRKFVIGFIENAWYVNVLVNTNSNILILSIYIVNKSKNTFIYYLYNVFYM